jgi:hypothetical protein
VTYPCFGQNFALLQKINLAALKINLGGDERAVGMKELNLPVDAFGAP